MYDTSDIGLIVHCILPPALCIIQLVQRLLCFGLKRVKFLLRFYIVLRTFAHKLMYFLKLMVCR